MGKTPPAAALLLERALAYPEAHEDHPWGETVVKVRGKVFVFLGVPGPGVHVTAKLGASAELALLLPFAESTGYGLGKAGWVTARFDKGEPVPVDLLLEWIDHSYRLVAPRKLVAALDAAAPAPAPARAPRRAARRPVKKRARSPVSRG